MIANAALIILATAGVADFHEAWYREVQLGDLEGAYREYSRIFLDGGAAPQETVSQETVSQDTVSQETGRSRRALAALRAGACGEKLGDAQKARIAYGWFRTAGDGHDALTRQAQARWRALFPTVPWSGPQVPSGAEPAVAEGAAAPGPAPAPAEDPAYPRGIIGLRREALAFVERTVAAKRLEEARAVRLKHRLLGLDVEVSWPDAVTEARSEDGGDIAPAAVESLGSLFHELALPRADEELLREHLATSLHLEGLRALRDLDLRRAAQALALHLEIAPAGGEPSAEAIQSRELLESLRRIFEQAAGVRQAAERWLPETLARRDVEARARIARALADADALRDSADSARLAASLDRVLWIADWAPVGAKLDGVLREPVAKAQVSAPPAVAAAARADRRQALRDASTLATDIALASAELLHGWTLPGGAWPGPWRPGVRAPAPHLEDPPVALRRLRAEVERVGARVEEALRAAVAAPGGEARLPADLATVVDDTLALLEWFPEIDPSGQHDRRLKRSLRP